MRNSSNKAMQYLHGGCLAKIRSHKKWVFHCKQGGMIHNDIPYICLVSLEWYY